MRKSLSIMAGAELVRYHIDKNHGKEVEPIPFARIAVIGALGQTGQMFVDRLSSYARIDAVIRHNADQARSRFPNDRVTISRSITDALKTPVLPQALILAVPNTNSREALLEIANSLPSAKDSMFAVTIILPQNGIGVIKEAQEILEGRRVNLIRASVFTVVTSSDDGSVSYNHNKLRIGLAPVSDSGNGNLAVEKSKALFLDGGFDVRIFDDPESMEYGKSVLNGIGATSAIVGDSIAEGLKRRYELEVRLLHDRLKILKAASIEFPHIPWSGASNLVLFDKLPGAVKNTALVRDFFIGLVAKERTGPPAAAVRIGKGQDTELEYYHGPWVELGAEVGLRSIVDESILAVYRANQFGTVDLKAMEPFEREEVLMGVFIANNGFNF